ncbi:MAG: Fic family protein [Planctomycetia bacterium]|nr:Fic family protein [Planctomycetia bacterium]
MEPMLVGEASRWRSHLNDQALELVAASTRLDRSLPKGAAGGLAHLVRSMNCYYSNLIEGHDTHPVDIERALRADYSNEPRKRDLQLEARSHIAVQAWIDAGGLAGRAATTAGVREIHQRFCEHLPEPLLWVENPDAGTRQGVVPGQWRVSDVAVGRHYAVSPGAVPRFMDRFAEAYARLGKLDSVLAAAAAHHRLLWIHPFTDGNGRVARLMSHAMLQDAIGSSGIWSIARGLARRETAYKDHLEECDQPRRGDLDGRGALSEESLAGFIGFFLGVCLDQVTFMEQLVQPEAFVGRVVRWANAEVAAGRLASRSDRLLESLLARGELDRGDVERLLDVSDRTARRVTSGLIARGVLVSDSSRAPLRLGFPATVAHEWLPGLFPEPPLE